MGSEDDTSDKRDGKGEIEARIGSAAAAAFAADVAANLAGAGIALEGSTLAVLLGAGAIPVFQATAGRVARRRSRSFDKRLREHGVTPERIFEQAIETPERFDVFRKAVSAALDTEHGVKRRLLADILIMGVLTNDIIETAYARRAVDTVRRIDALEIHVLRGLDDSIADSKGASRKTIGEMAGFESLDFVDAALAVLESEGLVSQGSLPGDQVWRLTGYGRRLLGELRNVGEETVDDDE